MAMTSRPEQMDYHGLPLIVVPDGTAWWAGEKSHYIDWSRDLRKDAIEGYHGTWSWHGFDRDVKPFLCGDGVVSARMKEIVEELEMKIFENMGVPAEAFEAAAEPLTDEFLKEKLEEWRKQEGSRKR